MEHVAVTVDNKLFCKKSQASALSFCCAVGGRFLATNTLFPFGRLAAELNVRPFGF